MYHFLCCIASSSNRAHARQDSLAHVPVVRALFPMVGGNAGPPIFLIPNSGVKRSVNILNAGTNGKTLTKLRYTNVTLSFN